MDYEVQNTGTCKIYSNWVIVAGWFPAKFVQLLDERSKQYSSAGDDSISETITDLVRGVLCPVIKQVFEHGMKRPNFLSNYKHHQHQQPK